MILMAYQPIKDYFMLRCYGIMFIVHSYLHFCTDVSKDLFCFLGIFLAHSPIEYE